MTATDDFTAWLTGSPAEAEPPEQPGPRAPRPDPSQGAGSPRQDSGLDVTRWIYQTPADGQGNWTTLR